MKIGNDLDINIWMHPWIPRLLNQTLLVSFQQNPNALVTPVANLCQGQLTLNWNVKLLIHNFGFNISYLIRKLQPPILISRDTIKWFGTRLGRFIVKDVYEIIVA